jgi:FAD-dependent oxidoreductase domain-containing protein 1
MNRSYDVVIAGGAIIGSAIAHFLASRPAFRGRVLVVEKDPSYATSSTVKSASSIRQQFSTAINIRISQFGIAFLRGANEALAVGGDSPGIHFTERGYLLLANEETLPVMRERVEFQIRHGVDAELLDPAEIGRRFPWLNLEGIAGAATTRRDEGWFDAQMLLNAFRRKAISNGAEYVAAEVTGVERDRSGHVVAALLDGGERIECRWLVNATGPYAGGFGALVGLRIPVDPHKRVVFVVDCPTPLPGGTTIIDANGLTFRPEGRGHIVHLPPPADQDPVTTDLSIDHDDFEARIWPLLAARVPAFEAARVTSAWAGHYDFNPFDHNALLGVHPSAPNFVFANGFSGHGVMQAPAVGRGIAELIADGRYTTLDLSPLDVTRYFDGRPLHEKNVY